VAARSDRRSPHVQLRSQTMLKKTLIATAALSATLLALATLLPALAQSRSTSPPSSAIIATSAPIDAESTNKRGAADDSRARTRTRQADRGQDRPQAEGSIRDDRRSDEDRAGSSGATTEKEQHESRA
jgi:hypothetical protein